MATYSAEPAKSGRSSCKKCKEKIEKDDLRIGTSRTTADDITMTSWVHAKCFSIPKKTDPSDFMESLEMSSLSPTQKEEIEQLLANASAAGKRKPDSQNSTSKRVKSDDVSNFTEEEQPLFEKYRAKTVEELKDYMRWNGQQITGTKGELIKRCIDGELNGALPACPQSGCKGRLKLDPSTTGPQKVSCSGAFDDELGTFIRCYFRANSDTITRIPWRESPKTEDEIAEEGKFESTIDTSAGASLYDGVDLTTLEGKKECISRFLVLARSLGINIPENDAEARVKLGTLLMNNSGRDGTELLALAEETYGTLKSSAAKLEQSTIGTVNEANSSLVAALSELSDLYFKSGNPQAGNSYRKAIAAIRQYPSVITSGKAISKGKGKLDGIGAKCGEIIDEFLETGTISKIDEKKSELSR